jgi:hypothetical protein
LPAGFDELLCSVVLCADRFCTTGLPSDVVFEVQDMSFHLHKVSGVLAWGV